MYLALGFDTGTRVNGHQTANSNESIDIVSVSIFNWLWLALISILLASTPEA